jgi:hypothetical protein
MLAHGLEIGALAEDYLLCIFVLTVTDILTRVSLCSGINERPEVENVNLKLTDAGEPQYRA